MDHKQHEIRRDQDEIGKMIYEAHEKIAEAEHAIRRYHLLLRALEQEMARLTREGRAAA